MFNNRKPILVTGSHRSGSAWVGRMLSVAPSTGYIHEPFNIAMKLCVLEKPFDNWFQYICKENEKEFIKALQKMVDFDYPFCNNLSHINSMKTVASLLKRKGLSFVNKINSNPPIIKDPIAIFSAEWLAEKFDMNVLVMIRHPAAFCSSLKLKSWEFDFNDFLYQPLLMNGYLKRFEKEIQEQVSTRQDIISQAILLWNCIHHLITIYQTRYPQWLFVRHEDLSISPTPEFQAIYNSLGLEFTEKAKEVIEQFSGEHNPIEQTENENLRNSKKNIHNWKTRLTSSEIEQIKVGTKNVSQYFYSESEW